MPRTSLLKLQKIKYFLNLLIQKVIFAVLAIDERVLCRIVTDLTIKGLSLNQIAEHIYLIYGLKITKEGIRSIRKNVAQKAKLINKRLDKEIASKVNTIECDEIFQGQNNLILGAAEKWAQYLLNLEYSLKRDKKALIAFLTPIARRFHNVRVVITDLLKAYCKSIKKAFNRVRHLGCHVHAGREILRKIDKFKAAYYRVKKSLDAINSRLGTSRQRITNCGFQINRFRQLIAKDKVLLKRLEIQKQNSKSGRTKTVDKKIAALKIRTTKRRDKISAEEKKLKKLRVQRDKLRAESRKMERLKNRAYHEHLQSCRLAADFKRILADKSPKFESHLKKFKIRLKKTKYAFAAQLLKLMQDNPHLFSLRKRRDFAPNFQNTNTIERIFGIFRPLLNTTRLIGSPEGTNEYCSLFRLYHNTMPRYTGINNNCSPYEQLGGKMDGKNYLDLIFPLRNRTTSFILSEEKMKSKIGFYVKGVQGTGVALLGGQAIAGT